MDLKEKEWNIVRIENNLEKKKRIKKIDEHTSK